MLITRLSRRYAKSLLDFAKEQGKVEEVKQDIDQLLQVIEHSREFRVLLQSPVISPDKKVKVFDAIFSDKLNVITSKFANIIIRKGREGDLESIARAFEMRYRDMKGIEKAVVTSAVQLGDAQREEIRKKLARITGSEIQIEEKIDPSIIGGIKLRVGDLQYNGSIAAQLAQMRRRFEKNHFVADF